MIIRGAVGALVMLVLASMAGCSDDPPPAPPSATGTTIPRLPSSSPPLPSVSPSPSPTLPAAATQPTRAGAEAFFRHFMKVYEYSFTTMKSEALRSISSPDCKFCNSTIRALDEGYSKGRRSIGHGVVVRIAVAAPDDVTVGVLVNAVLDQRAAKTVDSNGVVIIATPEKRNLRMDAVVRWAGDRWMFLDASFPGEGAR